MDIEIEHVSSLDAAAVDAVYALLHEGGQVMLGGLKVRIMKSHAVAVGRVDGHIISVGALKNPDQSYVDDIARKARHKIPSEALELGYFATTKVWEGQGLGTAIANALIERYAGPCFATTRSVRMKRILARHGFSATGNEWPGTGGGPLSLWVRI